MRDHHEHGALSLIVVLGIPALVMSVFFVILLTNGPLVGNITHALMAQTGTSPFGAHMASLFFWAVLFLVVGGVWVQALAPSLPLAEKGLAALVMGVFFAILPLLLPFAFISLAGANVTTVAEMVNVGMLDLFALNYEQSYAFAGLLLALVLGVMVWIAREIIRIAIHPPARITSS